MSQGSLFVTQIGNVGSEPESRMAGSTPVVELTLATNYGKGDKEETTWTKVSFFGKQGDIIKQYVHKGDQLQVIGQASTRAYMDKKGEARAELKITAANFTLLGSKEKTNGNPAPF